MAEEKETKKPSIEELIKTALGEGDEETDEIAAKLLDDKGKIKLDDALPPEYELDLMATLLLDHISSYRQNRQAWRAARTSGDHRRSKELFEAMNFNRLTAAIIQYDFPKAKALADTIAEAKVKQVQENRRKAKMEAGED